jgi:hypothetical protein
MSLSKPSGGDILDLIKKKCSRMKFLSPQFQRNGTLRLKLIIAPANSKSGRKPTSITGTCGGDTVKQRMEKEEAMVNEALGDLLAQLRKRKRSDTTHMWSDFVSGTVLHSRGQAGGVVTRTAVYSAPIDESDESYHFSDEESEKENSPNKIVLCINVHDYLHWRICDVLC